jgi:hypothetical protein
MECVLAAGIPFAFWTLQDKEVAPATMRHIIEEKKPGGLFGLLRKKLIAPKHWPQKFMQYRKQEIQQEKTNLEPVCLNLNMLWDHPKRLPQELNQLEFPQG